MSGEGSEVDRDGVLVYDAKLGCVTWETWATCTIGPTIPEVLQTCPTKQCVLVVVHFVSIRATVLEIDTNVQAYCLPPLFLPYFIRGNLLSYTLHHAGTFYLVLLTTLIKRYHLIDETLGVQV